MQKFLLLAALFFSQFTNAQYVRYRMDLLKGKINGKDMNIQSKIIQTDIKDTNDVLMIGFNSDNERVAVKFYLIKILTNEETYYLPSMQLYFVERSGFIKEVPFNTPDFEHPLTKTNKYYKMMGGHQTITKGENQFELSYNYYIDGNNLKYDEVRNSKTKPANVQLSLKSLKIDDSLVTKDKKLALKEASGIQTKEVSRYLKTPVTLNYKIHSGTIGEMQCIVFESALQYKDNAGKKDSTAFISGMSLVKKMTIIDMQSCDDNGKNCKSMLYCDYDLMFLKKE